MARICSISVPRHLVVRPGTEPPSRLDVMLDRVDQAAAARPDLIVLPEVFAQWRPFMTYDHIDEGQADAVVAAVAEKARLYQCYMICPVCHREGERLFNRAVLIDRQGRSIGAYDKIQPTLHEMESGVQPGTRHEVFDTDFGKIGIILCFDLAFLDIGRHMQANGAKLICFPSMYEGAFPLRLWAYQLQCYMISAVFEGRSNRIVDPLGRVVAVSQEYGPIINADVNLDFRVCQIDYNEEKILALQRQYGAAVTVELVASSNRYLVASNSPDIPTQKLIDEFQIEELDHFLERARQMRAQVLQK